MQSSFVQTINALLQQFQQSQPLQSPSPQTPSVDVLQRQLLQSIQTIDHSTPPQQPDLTGLFQSSQLQTSQSSSPTISSSQLLSDALKMIAPVGQSPNDEQLLVMALHSGLAQGLDHRRAIEALHGVNNHAANLWKDYYLEHRSRIDEMVNQLQPAKTAKKPVRFDLEPKLASASSEIKGKQLKEPKERPAAVKSLPIPSDSGSFRGNIIRHPPVSPPTRGRRKHRGPSRRSNLPIPPPPEVEPTRPTKVVKSVRGNLYTVEDKKYFAKYISWALQVDPSLTKTRLVAKLAENVPHHTAASWNAYWARDALADRLLAAARDRTIGDYQDQDSTADAGEEESDEVDQLSAEEESSHDSDEDEAAMGEHGSTFGAAEFRVMAKYIARHKPDEWATMTSKQRWFPFHEEHPHRTDKAYGEKYRNKEQELLTLAERYRRRAQRQLEKQRATPSWAYVGGRKRHISVHDTPSKRIRE